MTLTATEATLLFAVFLAALGWAGLITYEWWDTKNYNKRIVQINNQTEAKWEATARELADEQAAHDMTKQILQREKEQLAYTLATLDHAEKMLYGTERLRKDVMQ